MGYRIGSFNCLNFGRATSKDVRVFAEIICRERFDIVALQEIKGQGALNRILRMLPQNWLGKADNDGRVNDYAFIWNKRRVTLATTETVNISREYAPRIYNQYRIDRGSGEKELIRNPYYARFFPVGGGAPFVEFRIINTHIRFSKGQEENQEQMFSASDMRKKEFNVLTKAIYAKEADKRYGNNRPAYTILLGDYNLNLLSSGAKAPYLMEAIDIVDGNTSKRLITIQQELTTLNNPRDEKNKENQGFANNYDHFTYDSNRFQSVIISPKKIDSVKEYCNGDFDRHRKEISDHVPIALELDLIK